MTVTSVTEFGLIVCSLCTVMIPMLAVSNGSDILPTVNELASESAPATRLPPVDTAAASPGPLTVIVEGDIDCSCSAVAVTPALAVSEPDSVTLIPRMLTAVSVVDVSWPTEREPTVSALLAVRSFATT